MSFFIFEGMFKKGRIFISNPSFLGFQKIQVALIFIAIAAFSSCENNIEVIKTITKSSNTPTLVRFNTEITYTDSARIRVKILAPKLEHYSLGTEPYLLFPEGMKVQFYDDSAEIESIITSKYAKYFEKKRLWEARNDVVAKNLKKGEQLNTEELFWDETTALIYSTKFSRVTTPSGIIYGEEGLEANQNFSWYRMKGIKGDLQIKDEE